MGSSDDHEPGLDVLWRQTSNLLLFGILIRKLSLAQNKITVELPDWVEAGLEDDEDADSDSDASDDDVEEEEDRTGGPPTVMVRHLSRRLPYHICLAGVTCAHLARSIVLSTPHL